MKALVLCVLCAAMALAEPPVDTRYLPPQQGYSTGGNFQARASEFSTFGSRRQTEAVIRGRPSLTYGFPSTNSRANLRQPSAKYGAPQYSLPNRAAPQYNGPSAQVYSQYLPPSQTSSQYGPPQRTNMNRFRGLMGFGSPAGLSKQIASPRLEYGVPSQQYGAPGLGSAEVLEQLSRGANTAAAGEYEALEQSRRYLPPGTEGYNNNEDENGEPASYNFEYMVQDEESGNDFGHRESREGDRAEGLYYVLLPDGRKQTVEYEADQEGYKPRISYEDTGAASGEYDRNTQALGGYQGGYQSGNGLY